MKIPPAILAARHRAEVLFPREQVIAAIDRLAVRLTVALADENPLLVCVMNGGLPFTAALMQRLQFPLQQTYLHVGRYGSALRGGELRWKVEPEIEFADRHVVLVDDILDQGVTLGHLRQWALTNGRAGQVTTVVLLDKRLNTPRAIRADYVALECPDRYVFGWGMDFEGYWRNLPDIHALPADGSPAHDETGRGGAPWPDSD